MGRQRGQPAAANMRKLVWDNELATIAQRWADQCIWGHDKNRDLCDGTSSGQNGGISWSSREESNSSVWANVANMAAEGWYKKEVGLFRKSYIKPFRFVSAAGHYTQFVWAETDRVGCGLRYFKDSSRSKQRYPWTTLLWCNYASAGNFRGATMYEVGRGCSNCPSGKSCDSPYTALCA